MSPLPKQSSTEAEWELLEKHLAEALSDLAEDEYLILSDKRGNYYVQFAAQGAFGMRAEAVSNVYIDEPGKELSRDAYRTLLDLGWTPPTKLRPELETKGEPEGSPNFFVDRSAPVHCGEVARLAVRTFREAFDISHPGFLEYRAFHSNGASIRFPSLKIKRTEQ